MFLYRNTLCCGKRSAGCTIFWMIILIALCALDVIALGINSNYLATCNGIHAVGNPCNSPAWCCRAEVHVITANRCPNTMTCPGGGPPIKPDDLFLATFALNVVFVALELYFIAVPLFYWFLSDNNRISGGGGGGIILDNGDDDILVNGGGENDKTEAERALLDCAERIDIQSSLPSVAAVVAVTKTKMRRVPQTPLLSAVSTAAPIAHVTPLGEKNKKQP
jgi:hypothetical protein